MILAIDIGNTNIVFGCLKEGGDVAFTGRISTSLQSSAVEYAATLKGVLALGEVELSRIEGSILTSVVPPLTGVLLEAVELLTHSQPILVSSGVKTGMNLAVDNPAQLGSDRVVDAVAAYSQYGGPVIVVDMGTATTISVVDEQANFLGGMIMPGVRSSLEALAGKTAQLPHISLEGCRRVIGKNTVECMQSGILNGHAAMVDGLIRRLKKELGKEAKAVATGGFSRLITPRCEESILLEENLILKGLYCLYQKNKKNEGV